MPSSHSDIINVLAKVIDPNTNKPFGLKAIALSEDPLAAELSVCLPYPISERLFAQHKTLFESVASEHAWTLKSISRRLKVRSHKIQSGVSAIPGVKNVIAVSSGKGGVGKSTVAVNLAINLARMGATVGLLDADIYGPNIPAMLGVEPGDVTVSVEEKIFEPVMAHGCQSMSMAYLVPDGRPMVWRGPMVSGALLQLVQQTRWNKCDYLVVDMPPGTGDVQLTLSKKIPVTAAVVVTTPQIVALLDVQKGISMFEKVDIPVAGLIENMSGFTCPHCQESSSIFDQNGGAALADALGIPLLGSLPLQLNLREAGDSGNPLAATEPLAESFEEMAVALTAWLSTQGVDYSHHFGKVETN